MQILELQLSYKSHYKRFSQSLIQLLVRFMGQSLICNYTYGEVLLDFDLPFVWEVVSYIVKPGARRPKADARLVS